MSHGISDRTKLNYALGMLRVVKTTRVDPTNPTDDETAITGIVREWAIRGIEMGNAYTTRVGFGGTNEAYAKWRIEKWSERMADAVAIMWYEFEDRGIVVADETMNTIIDGIIALTKTMFEIVLDKDTIRGF